MKNLSVKRERKYVITTAHAVVETSFTYPVFRPNRKHTNADHSVL